MLINEAITEIHRLSHHKLTKLQNNATSCFDRMVRNLTTLSSRSFEVADQVCKLQASTLASIKYKMQTSLEISENTYCNTEKYLPHEQGQGTWNSGTS